MKTSIKNLRILIESELLNEAIKKKQYLYKDLTGPTKKLWTACGKSGNVVKALLNTSSVEEFISCDPNKGKAFDAGLKVNKELYGEFFKKLSGRPLGGGSQSFALSQCALDAQITVLHTKTGAAHKQASKEEKISKGFDLQIESDAFLIFVSWFTKLLQRASKIAPKLIAIEKSEKQKKLAAEKAEMKRLASLPGGSKKDLKIAIRNVYVAAQNDVTIACSVIRSASLKQQFQMQKK